MELLFVVLCLFGRRQRKRKVVEGEKESLKEFPAKRFRILMVEMVVSPCQQEKKKMERGRRNTAAAKQSGELFVKFTTLSKYNGH